MPTLNSASCSSTPCSASLIVGCAFLVEVADYGLQRLAILIAEGQQFVVQGSTCYGEDPVTTLQVGAGQAEAQAAGGTGDQYGARIEVSLCRFGGW